MPRTTSENTDPESTPDTSLERWPIPPDWRWAKVSELGNVKLGRQLASSKRRGAISTPYLRAANIVSSGLDLSEVFRMDLTERERESFALARGDIVLAEASGSPSQVGRSAVWNDEIPGCCLQNTVIRFRPHALLSAFAHLVFRYFMAAGIFARAAHGVGIQHLGASRFAQLDMPVPGTAEQSRIVEETNRRLQNAAAANASLESALKGIEEQITTVIEIAATGQAPAIGSAAATESDDASRKRPETTIGALARVSIPSSWTWSRVSEAGEAKKGKVREPRHEQGEHVVPYLRVANVFEDKIDGTDVLSMNFTPAEQEVFRLRDGDVLLNEGQSPELVGRPAIYRGDPPSVCFQNTLLRFRAGDLVDSEYALLVFRFYMRSGIFRLIAKWSTNIAHLSLVRFAELPFPLPPIPEQKKLVVFARENLKSLDEQRAVVLASISGVDEMRREIFAAAVRGNLSTRESGEESAADILARLGPPPREPKLPGAARPTRTATDADEQGGDEEYRELVSTLNENGGRMAAEDLFAASGYDRDLTRQVESFYLALREAEGKKIRIVGSDGGRSILEVIPDET
jgi:Type I restriction modification DNA specificity domain